MNARERFHETMHYGRPDRVPYLEEGLRDDVIEAWCQQGLESEAALREMFPTDRRENVNVEVRPQPLLEEPPTSRSRLQALRKAMNPDDPARLPEDWRDRVRGWVARDHVLHMPIHRGFFQAMGVRDWSAFLDALFLLHDDPALVHEVLDIYTGFACRFAERVLRDVALDFVTFSEPIGGNDGPLLSPQTYERFVLRSYAPIIQTLRRGGVRTIGFVTYANARALLPVVLDADFDCLWAMEVEAVAMDYRALRRQFGTRLRLIGGIDLDVLLADKESIRREIETKVPPLLAEGGYVPVPDGRVRPNVPFENYVYYRRLLEEVTS